VRARRSLYCVLAVLWIVAVGLIHLLPALVHGSELGSADILGVFGLGAVPGSHVYNGLSADQIRAFEPWAWLSWSDVHHGAFPLWNPYSGLGLPLLFNFQSAAASFPMLVGYLAPQRYGFTALVITTMLIGGLGVLWMCRRIRLRLLPSMFAATAFMLSGSFSGWLGWPMAGTTCWIGWAFGCMIMLIRSPRRVPYLVGLSVVLAFMAYAGHPETFLIVILSMATVAAVMLVEIAIRTGGLRSCIKPLIALGSSGIAALGLAAPLLLPGLDVLRRSTRGTALAFPLPANASADLLLAGYHGYPIRGSNYFGPSDYYETAAYIGIIALVLACVALVRCWRRPTVLGLGVLALLCGVVSYSVDAFRLLERLPVLQTVQWTRALMVLDFSLAVLAGIGLQVMLDHYDQRSIRIAWWASTLSLCVVVALLWFNHLRASMTSMNARIQATSFEWAAAQLGVLVLIGVVVSLAHGRRGRLAVRFRHPMTIGVALLGIETAFLLTATPSLWASASTSFPVTSAEARLESEVGQARVGFEACPDVLHVPDLGVLPESNDAYGIHEISVFDPILPSSYFQSYYAEIGKPVTTTGKGGFCPSLSTARLARHFGVGFVLASSGSPPPSGTIFKTTLAGENLYEVPGAGVLTVEPEGMSPDSPRATVAVVSTTTKDPSALRSVVAVARPSTLYVHVTNFTGWTATIDGRNLPLSTWGQTMLKAPIPPGRHVIVLHYFPRSFVVGLVLAGVTVLALVVAVLSPLWRRPRSHPLEGDGGDRTTTMGRSGRRLPVRAGPEPSGPVRLSR
jgi:Bacterial membrane protein YfhO